MSQTEEHSTKQLACVLQKKKKKKSQGHERQRKAKELFQIK